MYGYSSLVTRPQPRGARTCKVRLLAHLAHHGPSHITALAAALQWQASSIRAYCGILTRQQVLRRVAPATFALAEEDDAHAE